MLVVLVLKQLARLSKGFITVRTAVGVVRHSAVVAAIVGDARNMRHELLHRFLSVREVVDLLAGVVCAGTFRAISTLDVLNSIRA